MEQMRNATPEEKEAGMKPWIDWYEKLGDAVIDQGNPTGNAHKITKDGVSVLKSEVAGYTIIEAETMNKAQELLKDHPHLEWEEGNGLQVLEIFDLPGK